jgi:ornithine lipid ester-linked acyl 2-hydroxylase
MRRLILLVEWLITKFTRNGQRTFFEASEFPWAKIVEANTAVIRAELDAVLQRREDIPNFQDLSENQQGLTKDTQWKTFVLYGYGRRVDENCTLCPQTNRALQEIRGMKTAMFSILAPGMHIPEHCGPYKGVLRYHLGLIIPKPESQCRIRVGSETRSWAEGESMIFDDRYPHEVWNDSNIYRVVLFVDFLRPLPLPLALLNRLIVRLVAMTPFITVGIKRAREAGQRMLQQV